MDWKPCDICVCVCEPGLCLSCKTYTAMICLDGHEHLHFCDFVVLVKWTCDRTILFRCVNNLQFLF